VVTRGVVRTLNERTGGFLQPGSRNKTPISQYRCRIALHYIVDLFIARVCETPGHSWVFRWALGVPGPLGFPKLGCGEYWRLPCNQSRKERQCFDTDCAL